MKAALVSLGSKSSLMTLEAMKKYFTSVDNIQLRSMEVMVNGKELRILNNGQELPKYDCMYAKGSFRYGPLLRSITTAFYDTMYMPLKPNAYTLGHDKLLTHLAMQYNKVPMPDTYVVSGIEAAKKILGQIPYPIVLKFPQGTQGKGVMFADSFASASSVLDAMETLRMPFLIQEYVETDGSDIRAFVIGDKVVAGMKRKAIMGEKRANIHAGATGESVVLDDFTKKIAIKTAKSIGADICAVDILESAKGPEVIEANVSPGLQGITAVTKIDVADKIASFLFEQAKEFKSKGQSKATDKLFSDLDIKTNNAMQEIISNVDIRGDRILLPKIVTAMAQLDDSHEVVIKAEKGKITIERI